MSRFGAGGGSQGPQGLCGGHPGGADGGEQRSARVSSAGPGSAAVDRFYGRLLADPVLGPFFPGGVGARHRAYVVTVLGEALGGPERYRGPDIARAHRGLGIGDAHFDLAAAHLDATLNELGVPRHLTDQIVAVVAGLRPAVVTA